MAGGDKLKRVEARSMLDAIVRRNLDPSLNEAAQEALSEALRHLRTVRLDREEITTLGNMESINQAHSLYLQENEIKKIENVDILKNLRFLSLSGNRIEKIQNLNGLNNLKFLDLSHNLIKTLEAGELPKTLLILDLTGNPCTKIKDYRQQVLEALPLLQELDGETMKEMDNQDSFSDGDSSNSDDESLLSDDPDELTSVGQDMLQRSHQRRNRALKEHEERLAELKDEDGQPELSLQEFVCAEPQGKASLSSHNTDSKVSTTPARNKSHDTIKLHKNIQKLSLPEKKPEDLQKACSAMLTSKGLTTASRTHSGAARTSGEIRTQLGTITSFLKTLPSRTAQTELQTSKLPTEKTQGAAPVTPNRRQATSAPSTQKLHTATKKPSQVEEKPPTTGTPARSAPTQRQAVSASASKKSYTVSTKKNVKP
ncbi:leucine-rich repeat-containing protein 46 isoform X2 [Hyperolius riggenbachi]|uniref:leucine-rich repeat-containing protein 46 isoform X2 n=1 Tax=Hyperolius riggenbachi TaxID=752182 RepID=UPI0035A2C5B6